MAEDNQSNPIVVQPWTLPDYLEAMGKDVPTCKKRYALEFEALTELGKIYDRLAEAWRPKDRPLTDQERLRLILLFAVKNQMYGAVFSLLHFRTVDALNSTRLAIEATGNAHLLWKKPEHFTTYMDAYPNIGRDGAANQWNRSNKYREAFGTGEIFNCLKNNLGDVGLRLKEAYAIICYRASHAGRGILHNLQTRDGKVFYHGNELDETTLERTWSMVTVYYFDMALVFFEILKELIPEEVKSAWGEDMEAWRDRYGKVLQEKAKSRRAEDDAKANRT